jgi:hypothetical protein
MPAVINSKQQILDVLTDGTNIKLDALLLHNCLGADIAQDVGQLICYMFQHLSTGTIGTLTSKGTVTETPINSEINDLIADACATHCKDIICQVNDFVNDIVPLVGINTGAS